MQTGVSYFSSRVLSHVLDDLHEMTEAGCTYVVHCYTETDLAYHREAMGEIAKATRAAGWRSIPASLLPGRSGVDARIAPAAP